MIIQQLCIDKNRESNDLFAQMGFSTPQYFFKISFLTEPLFLKKENESEYIDRHFIHITTEKGEQDIAIGTTGILELDDITLEGLTCSSTLPFIYITYAY